jgi:hypothetical protein
MNSHTVVTLRQPGEIADLLSPAEAGFAKAGPLTEMLRGRRTAAARPDSRTARCPRPSHPGKRPLAPGAPQRETLR